MTGALGLLPAIGMGRRRAVWEGEGGASARYISGVAGLGEIEGPGADVVAPSVRGANLARVVPDGERTARLAVLPQRRAAANH